MRLAAIATTGALALATAVIQAIWLDDPTGHPLTFLLGWTAAAVVSAGVVIGETHAR